MAILIIGGCGFIGSHVAEVLAAAGEDLVIFDRNGDDPTRRHAAATYIKGDFGNRGALSGIFESNRVDRVVHLAASTLPGSSNRDPEFDVRSNIAETAGLLELCVRFGTKKILFLSSGGTVYGIPRYMPVDERHPTDPISSYGISKLSIEKYLHLYRHLHGLDYVALRAANPYGPRQLPISEQGVIGVFAYRMLCGEEIVVWGDGSVVRDYLHVHDLAHLCRLALASTISGVFNAGSGIGRSLSEVIAALEVALGERATVRYEAGRAFDVPRIVLDSSEAHNAFGWQPAIGFEHGLVEVRRMAAERMGSPGTRTLNTWSSMEPAGGAAAAMSTRRGPAYGALDRFSFLLAYLFVAARTLTLVMPSRCSWE